MTIARRRRRGAFLIEIVAVLGATAVLILLCATLIQSLLRLQKAEQDLMAEGAALSRLARDLRRDAHAAERAESGATLVLDGADGHRVEYRSRAGAIDRVEQVEGKVRRESYRLPARAAVAFETTREYESNFVALTISRAPGARRGADRIDTRMVAEVGRDSRLLRSRGKIHEGSR